MLLSAASPVLLSVPVRAGIPSPDWSGFSLGPLTVHAYALCILAGIAAAMWLTLRRWKDRGLDPEIVWDVVMWAVPAGIVGARAYHVLITDPAGYFGPGADPVDALRIWEGGLGIMGAVAFGAAAAWWVCRRHGVSLAVFADAAAPGLLLAQAIGRWGNWFNQELFGRPTTLPWGLEIDPAGANFPAGLPADTLFHPTFLYESLWNLAGVVLLLALDRRFRLDGGRLFALYLVHYGIGRMLIELFLRIDPSLMVLGLRVHVWTSLGLVLLGLVLFAAVTVRRRRARDGAAQAART
ncbi:MULTISPECIES: prolipoprotein diacylglyceryl transferase [unclassified Kocuria]|uniref:prolipoprotein diacylglyceryl transferase n=1 Tax=unclassified Kocuria TaxID=2649579 RepID=UPI00064A29B6|nr:MULTISPECIES: prolipoprotein diacylglyceryl transferase [unclassified Kocuria]KLU09253.1 diacylglyceryl transferase [Kocuria sp. SM24M-10]OLT09235.1 prolipoprotein diacylglyceryl transferase [Kocuria sp. CNJ-770]